MESKKSILEMARGAFIERVDKEMEKAIDNILDMNTKATAKRKIQLCIELVPDDSRELINVSVTAKSNLAPTNPVGTSLCITSNVDGEMAVVEMVPQVPGQTSFAGEIQETPKILRLANNE